MIKILKNFRFYKMEKKDNIMIVYLKSKFLDKYATQRKLLGY